MYDAAGGWGGTNPFGGPLVVLTHRVEDQPDPAAGFVFVDDFEAALARARELSGGGTVSLGGGADVIRQGLRAGVVDRARDLHGAGGPRWWEAALRGLRAGPRPRDPAGLELPLRDPREVCREGSELTRLFLSTTCRKPEYPGST
ncbi:hypothetical protein GCM10009584_23840 [Ornithinimicrobium humiphilum]